MSCSSCEREIKLKAKGLCNACYKRLRTTGTLEYKRVEIITTCLCCKMETNKGVKGLCRTCYQRWRKNGTTDYKPIKEPQFCHIKGCGSKAVAKGLCGKHRSRLERTGTTDVADPYRGSREKHPLYHSWIWIRRYKTTDAVCDEWYDDFFQFVMDVGDKPSKNHKFYRADDSKPYGKDNFVWKESVTQKVEGEDEQTFKNRRARVYRSLRKEAYKEQDLKKNYGVTLSEYNKMLISQNNACAICEKPETVINGSSKKVQKLAVDHCHTTGAIRGLLCSQCNTSLGGFKDSKDILLKAIDYLNKFS